MSTTIEAEAEVTLGPQEPSTTPPAGADPLDVLANEIEELHDLAERNMRTSLDYARLAGAKLIEAKAKVKYGQWQEWIATKCGLHQSTANLYMKVAREWNRYAESQRVGIFSLRDAAQLLYMDNDEEHANAVGELVNLDLIRSSDLDGLDPIERRTFVNEVRSFYDDYCVDDAEHKIPDALRAKREADGWSDNFDNYNHRAIKIQAHRVLAKLKNGQLTKPKVRSALRVFEQAGVVTPKQGKGGGNASLSVARIRSYTPLQAYYERARLFIAATRALLTGPHGLLGFSRPDERPPFSREACGSVLDVIQQTRAALDTLEKQAQERIREFDAAHSAEVAARGPTWEPDCDEDDEADAPGTRPVKSTPQITAEDVADEPTLTGISKQGSEYEWKCGCGETGTASDPITAKKEYKQHRRSKTTGGDARRRRKRVKT